MEDDHGLPRIQQAPQELKKPSMWLYPALHHLRYLAATLGVDHAALDLANAFLGVPLAAESPDQFAFTREGQQGTLRNFPKITNTAPPNGMGR